VGVAFTIDSYRLNPSAIEGEGPPAYAVIRGRMEDGSPVTITCGAVNVLAQLHKLAKLGKLPVEVTMWEGNPTARGYRPLWLRAAGEEAF
jgi:hypothetical protein